MAPYCEEIILYVGDDSESERARDALVSAGFAPEVEHISPVHPRALYGTPVLFGFGNRFDGLEGVRVFIENAMLLGCRAAANR